MKRAPKISEKKFDILADKIRQKILDSVSPFENDTPELKAERTARGVTDMLFFCQTYLPHYFNTEFGEFHREWEKITEIQNEFIPLAAPREHGKSTFFTLAAVVRNCVYGLRKFNIICSDSNDQATGFTLAIRVEFESNQRLRHDFGDLVSPYGRRSVSWKRNDFTTDNGVRVLARGRGEKVRGLKNRQYRPDFVVIDDFENDMNVRNPRLVTEGKQWITRALIGSLGYGYAAIMIGNIFHPNTILNQFINEKDDQDKLLYRSFIYQAWIDYGTKYQRPLWPELWPVERLEQKKRQMSTRDFNAEMMNLSDTGDSPFKDDWFKYYDTVNLNDLDIVTFVDPSGKSGENNDYKAAVTVGLDRQSMQFYVLHAWVRHATIGEMFDAIYKIHAEYGGHVGIEENNYEEFLHEAINNAARERGKYLPWKPYRQNKNKEGRIIGTLGYLIEYGKMFFKKGHSDQNLVIEQLIYILNKTFHDDGADALEGAVSILHETGMIGAYQSVQSKQFKRAIY